MPLFARRCQLASLKSASVVRTMVASGITVGRTLSSRVYSIYYLVRLGRAFFG